MARVKQLVHCYPWKQGCNHPMRNKCMGWFVHRGGRVGGVILEGEVIFGFKFLFVKDDAK